MKNINQLLASLKRAKSEFNLANDDSGLFNRDTLDKFGAYEDAAKALWQAVVDVVRDGGKAVIFFGAAFDKPMRIENPSSIIGRENVEYLRFVDSENYWQTFRMSAAEKVEVR